MELLLREGQGHLFQHWQPGQNEEDKLRFLNQVLFDCPGFRCSLEAWV